MAWSGGTFTRANPTWASDAAGGLGIEAGRHDAQDNDFTTGINQCINKDGSNAMTGNLNLGTNEIRNVNKLGIGTSAPTEQITIIAAASDDAAVSFRGNATSAANEFYVGQSSDGATVYIYNRANGAMIFGTNNLERMRIDASGYVGINQTPTVGAGLAVKSKTNNGTDNTIILTNSSGTVLFQQDSNGAIYSGIGGSSPYNLHTLNAANMYVESNGLLYRSVSASKYKDDIQNMSYGLDTVKQLRPVTYKLKGDATSNRRFAGLIAEEVNDLGLTEFVQYDANNQPDALNYSHFVALAFKAIQELSAKVEELEARLPEVSEPA